MNAGRNLYWSVTRTVVPMVVSLIVGWVTHNFGPLIDDESTGELTALVYLTQHGLHVVVAPASARRQLGSTPAGASPATPAPSQGRAFVVFGKDAPNHFGEFGDEFKGEFIAEVWRFVALDAVRHVEGPSRDAPQRLSTHALTLSVAAMWALCLRWRWFLALRAEYAAMHASHRQR